MAFFAHRPRFPRPHCLSLPFFLNLTWMTIRHPPPHGLALMTHRHFCTYFDERYFSRGMAMLQSLRQYQPDAQLTVLCLSAECAVLVRRQAWLGLGILTLDDLAQAWPALSESENQPHTGGILLHLHAVFVAGNHWESTGEFASNLPGCRSIFFLQP